MLIFGSGMTGIQLDLSAMAVTLGGAVLRAVIYPIEAKKSLVSVWESPCGHFYNTALKTDNLKTNYYNIGCSLTNKSSTPENLILVELLQFRSISRMFLLF